MVGTMALLVSARGMVLACTHWGTVKELSCRCGGAGGALGRAMGNEREVTMEAWGQWFRCHMRKHCHRGSSLSVGLLVSKLRHDATCLWKYMV